MRIAPAALAMALLPTPTQVAAAHHPEREQDGVGEAVTAGASHLTPKTRHQIQVVRRATERFRNVRVARRAGYVPAGECVAGPEGGMGVHYTHPGLAADPRLAIRRPEILVYEPHGDRRRLVGGHLVIQDYDLLACEVVPTFEAVEEFKRVASDSFRDAGRNVRLGLRLPALHAEAGLGAPDGIDVGARVSPQQELAPVYEAVYRSMLESALLLGLTTQANSERRLETFTGDTAHADANAALWPLLIGTWKRKP
jgi:hypothetical protein